MASRVLSTSGWLDALWHATARIIRGLARNATVLSLQTNALYRSISTMPRTARYPPPGPSPNLLLLGDLASKFIDRTLGTALKVRYPPHVCTPTSHNLGRFIADIMHRCKLPTFILHYSLVLIERLTSMGSNYSDSNLVYDTRQMIFLSAYLLAQKFYIDEAFQNKIWRKLSRESPPYSVEEINRVERDMCKALEWNFRISDEDREALARKLDNMKTVTPTHQSHNTSTLFWQPQYTQLDERQLQWS